MKKAHADVGANLTAKIGDSTAKMADLSTSGLQVVNLDVRKGVHVLQRSDERGAFWTRHGWVWWVLGVCDGSMLCATALLSGTRCWRP